MVVLGEAVGFVPDVLQQLKGWGSFGQFQWFGASLQVNILLSFGNRGDSRAPCPSAGHLTVEPCAPSDEI